jgi:hypothetical protein
MSFGKLSRTILSDSIASPSPIYYVLFFVTTYIFVFEIEVRCLILAYSDVFFGNAKCMYSIGVTLGKSLVSNGKPVHLLKHKVYRLVKGKSLFKRSSLLARSINSLSPKLSSSNNKLLQVYSTSLLSSKAFALSLGCTKLNFSDSSCVDIF